VLALDEPTTLLDLRHRDALLERLDALPQQQIISKLAARTAHGPAPGLDGAVGKPSRQQRR
jgi:recombinational DNA repair ATPase RecF